MERQGKLIAKAARVFLGAKLMRLINQVSTHVTEQGVCPGFTGRAPPSLLSEITRCLTQYRFTIRILLATSTRSCNLDNAAGRESLKHF